MGQIVLTKGAPVLIEDRSLPIEELKVHKGLFKDISDAVFVCKEKQEDVLVSANTGKATDKGHLFRFPTAKEIQAAFPTYKVVHNKPQNPAIPVTVTLTLPATTKQRAYKEQLHYRTLTAFRGCWGLTVTQAEIILQQHPGWKALLPGIVSGATMHEPGWTPPGGWPAKTADRREREELFRFTRTANGMAIKYVGPTSVEKPSDLSSVITSNGSF